MIAEHLADVALAGRETHDVAGTLGGFARVGVRVESPGPLTGVVLDDAEVVPHVAQPDVVAKVFVDRQGELAVVDHVTTEGEHPEVEEVVRMRERGTVTGDLGVDDSFLGPAHQLAVPALAVTHAGVRQCQRGTQPAAGAESLLAFEHVEATSVPAQRLAVPADAFAQHALLVQEPHTIRTLQLEAAARLYARAASS